MIILRIELSWFHLPTGNDWLIGSCVLLTYALIAAFIGVWRGFLKWSIVSSRSAAVRIVTTSFIAPALLEELFFRVMLLPHPSEGATSKYLIIWSSIGLFLFAVYHPLNGLSFFAQGRQTFFNPVFLVLAIFLGLACTVAYLYTGSIWIPVTIHWLVVTTWLLCLGGINRLELFEQQ